MPAFGSVLSAGWTTWNGTAEITATNGHYIMVAEVDSAGRADKAGQAVVVALLIAPEQLSTPTSLVYDDGTLTFTGDTNATRYELAKLVEEDYISIGSTADGTQSFPISTLSLDAGTYNIAVMAIGDEPDFDEYTNSEWSATVEVAISE